MAVYKLRVTFKLFISWDIYAMSANVEQEWTVNVPLFWLHDAIGFFLRKMKSLEVFTIIKAKLIEI